MAENSAIPAWKMPAYWGIDYQVDSLFSTLSSSSATSSGLYPITHTPRFDLTPLTTKSLHVGVIVRLFLVAGLLLSTGNLMTAQNITATDLKKELDAIRGELQSSSKELHFVARFSDHAHFATQGASASARTRSPLPITGR